MGESGGMEIESEREILSIVGELKAPGPDGMLARTILQKVLAYCW